MAVLPNAFSFTLLGAIESLLSAVVADGMTGRRHRSNMELVAQGVANVGSALFGGFCVTGTIARTATNVRAGAHGPVAGMAHSAFLLVFVLVAAPLAGFVPLAALAAVLAVVAWDMVEKPAIRALLGASRGDAAVLLVTFGLTIFRDLERGDRRRLRARGDAVHQPHVARRSTVEEAPRAPYARRGRPTRRRWSTGCAGALFFGAVSAVGAALDRIGDAHRVLVIDLAEVTLVDSSAANMIEGLAAKARRRGVAVYLSGAAPALRRALLAHGRAAAAGALRAERGGGARRGAAARADRGARGGE